MGTKMPLGRFLSVDPLAPNFPWYTPYQYAGNTPVQAIDLDGAEELVVIREKRQVKSYLVKKTEYELLENNIVTTGAPGEGIVITVIDRIPISTDWDGNVTRYADEVVATYTFLPESGSAADPTPAYWDKVLEAYIFAKEEGLILEDEKTTRWATWLEKAAASSGNSWGPPSLNRGKSNERVIGVGSSEKNTQGDRGEKKGMKRRSKEEQQNENLTLVKDTIVRDTQFRIRLYNPQNGHTSSADKIGMNDVNLYINTKYDEGFTQILEIKKLKVKPRKMTIPITNDE